jgi:FkbM family methyltransferase
VWCFDPTPGGIRTAEATMRQCSGVRFEPWGVGDRDEIVTFYGPRHGAPGSLSAANLGGGAAVVEAQMLRLSEIARRIGAPRIDLLKIDIEGSEYGVIDEVAAGSVTVDQFLVEFDQPMPPWRTERAVERLLGAGYWLADVWGLNAFFVHDRVLAAATATHAADLPGVWAEFEAGGWHTASKDSAAASGGKRVSWFDQEGRAVYVTFALTEPMPKAVLFLLGSELDYEVTPLHEKFVFRNPNQTDACGCGESVTIVPATAE